MKKSRFSESQIISILKGVESGPRAYEVYRKHGISTRTYYNWESKYGGVGTPEFKRAKELEAENVKLERIYADLTIENSAIRDLLEEKP